MSKKGILLVNLGTPNSYETADVRKYLREFLMDKYVIDLPYLTRWFLVNVIIATFRALNRLRFTSSYGQKKALHYWFMEKKCVSYCNKK